VSIKKAAIVGAATGAAVALIMLIQLTVGPFSPDTNALLERVAFRLCPLYLILMFTNTVKSMVMVNIITIAGNAVLYGFALVVIVSVSRLIKRVAWGAGSSAAPKN
jgi:hypothetical protein